MPPILSCKLSMQTEGKQTPWRVGSVAFLCPGKRKEMREYWLPFYNMWTPAILVMAVTGGCCSQGRPEVPHWISCRVRP